ncbi:MAG: GH1 family beta-glucosidase [Bacillota bacterium]|nr:GH1 family beta-glucosidase [Bacillota bacterium]
MSKIIFPEDFIWGAATSAYQIEGAAFEDGKGESIWDRFSHTPGKIKNEHNGDIACDHYHLYAEDVKLMKELGLKSYRFSISWPRIFPDGDGKLNVKGMEFYKKLVNLLLENDIIPNATLYHWDLPQKLQDKGGWTNRETADRFADFAGYVFKELGDLVPFWATLNEPAAAAFAGYAAGVHAPGLNNPEVCLAVAHNLLLAHGKAVKAYRQLGLKGKIGIVLDMWHNYPATDSEEDIKAAWINNNTINKWFSDPVFKGLYPTIPGEPGQFGMSLPEVQQGDMELISTPVDFLGLNVYSRNVVKANPDIPNGIEVVPQNGAVTDIGWEVYPQVIYDLLTLLHKEYNGIDIYITENGAAFRDTVNSEGRVEDDDRVDYLRRHFEQAHRAIEAGVNLKGYYVWSLMDNFEWAEGYTKRFGIVHVDFDTLTRTPKNSALWYSEVIRENGF